MTQQQPNCATPQNPQVNPGNPQGGAAEPKPEAQRDQRGRFAAGNRGGPGNPFARQTAALRQALVNAVSEKDIADIAAVLLEKARQGDVAASRLVFAYALGKPAAAANPDTLDQEEMKTLANNHVDYDDMDRIAKLMPVAMMLKLFHVMLPYLDQAKAKQWQDMWQDLGAQMDQQQAEDEAADRNGGQLAVAAKVLEGLVASDGLVLAVGVDQLTERLEREVQVTKGRRQPLQQRM